MNRTNEELCMAYQQGDKDALEKLYTQNTGMIEKIVRKYAGAADDLDDLRQEAFFGVRHAAEMWKPDRGAQWISYAAYFIRQSIFRYIDNCGGVVRIPVHRRALIRRYHKFINSFRQKFGQIPSDRELCLALDLTKDQLEDLKKDSQGLKVRSTSELIGDDGESTLEDFIQDDSGDHYEDLIDRLENEQLAACLWPEVDSLTDQQSKVIRGRFKEGCTLAECGAALGVTTERARQIETAALKELRKPKHSKRLVPYLTLSSAYSLGIRNVNLNVFTKSGSSQELAMMKLEEFSGVSLWHGKKVFT